MKIVECFVVGAALFLVGCSSVPEKPKNMPYVKDANVKAAKARLDQQWLAGKHLLSPDAYKEAKANVEMASELSKDPRMVKDMQKRLVQANTDMQRVESNFTTNTRFIGQALAARDEARLEGAFDSKHFIEADNQLTQVGRYLEQGEVSEVQKEIPRIVELYEKAEVEAIQLRNLATARANVKAALKLDGDDRFDSIYEATRVALIDAEKSIASNKDHRENYFESVEKANLYSKRLLALSQSAETIDDIGPAKTTLWLENRTDLLSSSMGESSLQEYAVEEKFNRLNESAGVIAHNNKYLSRRVGAVERNQDRLEAKNKKITSTIEEKKRMEKTMRTIRAMFSPSEADVATDGNTVSIQLKGLNFAPGQTRLPKGAEALLAKVGKAIAMFNSPDIRVEGHADATGPALLNRKLSLKRAYSVEDYLVSHSKVAREEIYTTGFGFMKPIADNRSSWGQQQNRRVDVVISPQSTEIN